MPAHTSLATSMSADARAWRRFSSSSPAMQDLVEIRRLHDNKTILRRRADLPPGFAWKEANWRPA